MIYAKINPSAQVSKQTSPFNVTTTNLEYMTVYARPYGAGASKINFEVKFGIITFDENNNPLHFENFTSTNTTLTSDELSDWGTDDTIILSTVATKLGTSATNFFTIND